ncbi:glycosyltransferase [Vagococcus acidifermentans]|uniref:Glycosyltransferase 2-like domain-containing protein n=1 Tax=Vagococcus acidifermentans TaxID=564710 RepID=A0A430ATT1_9ENTE|nr:glycosyltransferase [Vagococcus acidifermentans]RSU11474.1 hypothetical protein CBF27_08235 [Vagococcus acidifermentans]
MNVLIVLNYNDYVTTNDFVLKVKDYSSVDYVIVVDNMSTDNSYEALLPLDQLDNVDVVRTPHNGGYGYGNNFGIDYARRKFSEIDNFIISNPDVKVSNDSIKNILVKLSENKKVSAASGLVKDAQGKTVHNFAWKVPDYCMMLQNTSIILTKLSMKLKISRFYGIPEHSDVKYVEVLSGCFFIIKHKAFKAINFFDESTFLYNEENIIFFQLKELGYKQIVLLDEEIIHFEGQSISRSVKNFFKMQSIVKQSELVYLKKYLKINQFSRVIYEIFFLVGCIEKWTISAIRRNLHLNKDH